MRPKCAREIKTYGTYVVLSCAHGFTCDIEMKHFLRETGSCLDGRNAFNFEITADPFRGTKSPKKNILSGIKGEFANCK